MDKTCGTWRPELGEYNEDAANLARKSFRARSRGTGMHLTADEVIALHILNGDGCWWQLFNQPKDQPHD